MKYLVFAGERYYPNGGWRDFYQGFELEVEAKECVSNLLKDDDKRSGSYGIGSYYWGHVVSVENNIIIYSLEKDMGTGNIWENTNEV